jgi:signal transduction histidine kinase
MAETIPLAASSARDNFRCRYVLSIRDRAGRRMKPDVKQFVDKAIAPPGAVVSPAGVPNDPKRGAHGLAHSADATLDRLLLDTFAQSPVGTIVYDATGRPILLNAAFERLSGASLADIPAGYSILTDLQLEKAGVLAEIRRAFAGEVVRLPPLRDELATARAQVPPRLTQAQLYPIRLASGQVTHVVALHIEASVRQNGDTTPNRTARRAERLQTLSGALSTASTMNEVAEAVVLHTTTIFDAVGTVIARVSDDGAYLELMRAGAMPEDVQEAWRRFPVSSPVPMADVARSGDAMFLESRDDWATRYPHLLPLLESTGQHANAVMPLIVDGRVLGVMGAAFDAPTVFDEESRAVARAVALQCAQALERARLFEAERQARVEAEAANRAKAQFLTIMSHELRTPLNAIGGYTELIELGIHGPVTPEQREDLRRIQASQRHLLGLINEVLNYAKVETGTVHYDFSDVNVREAVRAAEALVSPQVEARGLTLTVGDCPRELAVRADAEKLRQILVNLLGNAVKFSNRGGRIDLTCDRSGSQVRIHVSDTGIGIPAQKLEAIFEPFVQVRSDLTRTTDGVGLGLAISRDLARAMGGDLSVQSGPEAGSQFTLTLPATPA